MQGASSMLAPYTRACCWQWHARGHLDTMDSGLVQATYSVRPASSTVERGVRGRKGTLCGDMHDDA